MDQDFNQLPRQLEGRRDDEITLPTTAADAAAIPRHLFTLTVEDVAVMLMDHYVPRDQRTIQRWCKSGKLQAIIDHEAGDRYLIEPTSAREFVATLVAEKKRQDEEFAALSRQHLRQEPTPADTAATTAERPSFHNADNPADADQPSRDAEATAQDRRDDDAAIQKRIAELEEENRSLKIDKQARDQVISMIREEYTKAIDHALARSEQVGALQAEVRQLRELLPPDSGQAGGVQQPISFTPKSVYQDSHETGDNPRRDDFGAL